MRLWVFFFILHLATQCNAAQLVPRKILAIYDSRVEKTPSETLIHLICEMPLNYLGMDVIYHDLQFPLPDLSNRQDIRGIITCFPHGMSMEDPKTYLQWAERAIVQGKKYVILSDPGFKVGTENSYTPSHLINSFYRKLGIFDRNDWTQYTFPYQIVHKDSFIVEFEHSYPAPLPPFSTVEIINPEARSLLTVGIKGDEESTAHLVIISPTGGYVAQYFSSTFTKEEQAPEARYWYINPFEFFRHAFGILNIPIPDSTTLAGRRMAYSQVDGDAWNSVSEIDQYRQERTLCSDILYQEIFTKYPQIPFSVGIIAADVDIKWVGSEKGMLIAKKISSLPNIEIASHTYSHPFNWEFFHDPDQQKKEIDYLHLYPYGSWQSSYLSWLRSAYYLQRGKLAINERNLGVGYATPRAYANYPFDLVNEIDGSSAYLNQFLPKGKKIELFQWSGNCQPWSEAIGLTRELKMRNINGGSVRKDNERPSYCNVGPLGRKIDEQIQIYASADDENAYTYDWKGRFYGFKYLIETFKNTENPYRIKPIDLHYHFYSAEKQASFKALISNINYINNQEVIWVWPSRFAAAADGFYSLEIVERAPNQWQISHRQGLETVRFDNTFAHVDYARSLGVIGHRQQQNSLYIYLDMSISIPTIVLAPHDGHNYPYLIESSWEVWDVLRTQEKITFTTKGWGTLKMLWKLPSTGSYLLRAYDEGGALYEAKGVGASPMEIHFDVNAPSNSILRGEIIRK